MKNIIFFLQLFTLIFLASQMTAQTIGSEYGHISMRPVTAQSGLVLRDGPNTAFQKIALIPFGTNIVTAQTDVYFHDIIEEKEGHWLKANFEGKTGYVFDGFLGEEKYSTFFGETYGEQNSPTEKIMGIFTEASDKYGFQNMYTSPVKWDSINFTLTKITTPYIGKKEEENPFPIYSIMGVKNLNRQFEGYLFDYDDSALLPGAVKVLHFAKERYIITAMGKVEPSSDPENLWASSVIKNYKLSIKKIGEDASEEQTLLEIPEIFISEWGAIGLPNIRLAGDIDNDGKPDLIIEKYFEASYADILFLSSEADNGYLMKLVFMAFMGCC